ncbi:AAA family ATPase [Pelagibacterium flavum]|uniref:AAA family ATPase n=1 Tax=Pelagibacterium flavum TaxID=2984530 RepID=A0ABY6IJS1_9HYPH|nr:AAA family ATPase [Pelagibacterium sp. YIM 151497]UYQ70840.1 AAA family ATPase [Pelagibacterium sp. YIM 151497]
MSFSKVSKSDNLNDLTGSNLPPQRRRPQTTVEILVRLHFQNSFSARQRKALEQPGNISVVKTPSAEWAIQFERNVEYRNVGTDSDAITELLRRSGKYEPTGADRLAAIFPGASLVVYSQDPEGMVHPKLLYAANNRYSIGKPTLKTLRDAIRVVTGHTVRSLNAADYENLDLDEIAAAIRPDHSPKQCVANLRAANARHMPSGNSLNDAPLLKDLPLPRGVEEWATEAVELMNSVASGQTSAAHLPYSIVYGPPGTGKTTVCESIAKTAGWAYHYTSVGWWFEAGGGHLGSVMQQIGEFFQKLEQSDRPVVGMIDEIESLGDRGTMTGENRQWWTPVVTGVMTKIDQLKRLDRPILLLAGTNYLNNVEKALVRAGRLERHVHVGLPSEADRGRILRHYLGERLASDTYSALGRLTIGKTAADLRSLALSAISSATRQNRPLQVDDLFGPLLEHATDPDHERTVAIHEAGHAIVAWTCGLEVGEVSILPEGTSGGWTSIQRTGKTRTLNEVRNFVIALLAGRAADEHLGKGPNSGASADLSARLETL